MPADRPLRDFSALSQGEIEQIIADQRLPPVERWNPPFCGHSGMRIARDGTWYHDGAPIRRPELVKLFSSVLRREPDGRFMLVTPVEKLEIDVDAAPLRAVEMQWHGEGREQWLAFRLATGETVVAGPEHPIRMVEADGALSPRLIVRNGLDAELERSIYYELAELALASGEEPAGVWSGGTFFPLSIAA